MENLEKEEDTYLTNAKDFESFLTGIIHQWLKTLTGLGITLIPLFGILDYFIMPTSVVHQIWIYRLINTSILIVQYLIIRKTRPARFSYLHGYFASAVTSITIIQMTVVLGGFNSSYYQGLNLVIIAVNLLIPWRYVHSIINGSLTVILYIIINAANGQPDVDPKMLTNNLFFLIATVVISVSINFVRYNLIKKEFMLRIKLKAARDALWGEMEIAKKIQTALLPESTQMKNYESYAKMIPAAEVGGDYYDVIETQNGDTWIAIGDVSGHGVESGLIMMMTHTCIYSLVNQNKVSPTEVLDKVNYVIKENIRRLDVSRYVTLTILKLENGGITHTGKHQDILVYRDKEKKIEPIQSIGTWIGITDDIASFISNGSFKMNSGDVILLYTDGITEAESKDGLMYGFERLMNVFLENATLPTQVIVENIIADVLKYQHRQNDDITLLACRKN